MDLGINVQKLLTELSNSSVKVKVKDTCVDDIENPNPVIDINTNEYIGDEFGKLWDFNIVFNKQFIVNSSDYLYLDQVTFHNYKIYLDDLKENVYNEISEFLISQKEAFEKSDYLATIRFKFNELLKNENLIRTRSEAKSINKKLERELISVFLEIRLNTINSLLSFIDIKYQLMLEQKQQMEEINSEEILPHENVKLNQVLEEIRLHGRSKNSKNSFEINIKKYNIGSKNRDLILDEKIKDFHDILYKNGFIRKIDYRDFNKIFLNKPVKKQIRWETDAKELYYLIKTLHDDEIILPFYGYWQVTCKCFIAYHKKSRVCTPSSLARCHKPTLGERLRKLNSVIDTLK